MAQAGYTPILIYASSTPGALPSAANLTSSASGAELAINYADGKLYYKDGSGNVKLLSIGYGSSSVTPTNGGVQYGTGTALALTAAGSSGQILRSNGAAAPTWADLSTLGVNTISFGTTGLTPNSATAGAVTVAGTLVTANGGTGLGGATPFTANGVLYASSASALTSGSALTFDGTTLTAAADANRSLQITQYGTYSMRVQNPSTDAGALIDYSTKGAQSWTLNGSEQMRLTSTGLGIGTSSPTAAKLHVAGYNGGSVYPIRMTSTNSGVEWAFETGGTNAATSFFAIRDIGNSSTPLTINSSGNLGIGTTSPNSKFEVQASAGEISRFSTAAGYRLHIYANASGSAGSGIQSQNSDLRLSALDSATNIRFFTGNGSTETERMRLDSSGNLGIGTSSPTAKLDVAGNYTNPVFKATLSGDPNGAAASVITVGSNTNGGLVGGGGYGLQIFDKTSNSGSNQTGYGLYVSAPYDGANASGSTYAVTKYGVYVDDIYGFYGNNSTGTWGLYVKGGLNNYIAGNLGLGVTPSAWNSSAKAFDMSTVGCVVGDAFTTKSVTNAYYNQAGSWIYKTTAGAARFEVERGAFAWYTAPSGTAGNPISFGDPKMTLDASGNLLVGTTSSIDNNIKVQLATDGTNTQRFFGVNNNTGYGILFGFVNNTEGNVRTVGAYPLTFGTNNTERARIGSDGTFAVGTTSAVSQDGNLVAAGSVGTGQGVGNTVVQINIWETTSGNKAGLWFGAMTNSNVGVIGSRTASGAIAFQTYNSGWAERARITSGGDLLVGTTSYVDYANGFGVSPAPGFGTVVSIGHESAASSGRGYIIFGYNGSGIGSITQNGTTAVAYNTSSDYRLKNTIAPMTGALAKVAQLKPVTYKWNADGSDGEGFIAHELAEVVPQCVTGEKDAVDAEGKPVYQGIDTSFLVATLTAAIQEQQALITSLTARVALLEGN